MVELKRRTRRMEGRNKKKEREEDGENEILKEADQEVGERREGAEEEKEGQEAQRKRAACCWVFLFLFGEVF